MDGKNVLGAAFGGIPGLIGSAFLVKKKAGSAPAAGAPVSAEQAARRLPDRNAYQDLISNYLTDITNAQKANLAQKNRAFDFQKHWNERAEKLAREIFEKQTELSNTAIQRRVADLKKAGINPRLAGGGAGAAVPAFTGARTTAAFNPGGMFKQQSVLPVLSSLLNNLGGLLQIAALARRGRFTPSKKWRF